MPGPHTLFFCPSVAADVRAALLQGERVAVIGRRDWARLARPIFFFIFWLPRGCASRSGMMAAGFPRPTYRGGVHVHNIDGWLRHPSCRSYLPTPVWASNVAEVVLRWGGCDDLQRGWNHDRRFVQMAVIWSCSGRKSEAKVDRLGNPIHHQSEQLTFRGKGVVPHAA